MDNFLTLMQCSFHFYMTLKYSLLHETKLYSKSIITSLQYQHNNGHLGQLYFMWITSEKSEEFLDPSKAHRGI